MAFKQFTIIKVEQFGESDLIKRLRKVSMLTQPKVFPYAEAHISLKRMNTNQMSPAQSYVLTDNLMRIQWLQWELTRWNVDLYNLQGFVRIWTDAQDEPVDVMPSIIEKQVEADGKFYNIINDGMHRCWNAYRSIVAPQVVLIEGVSKKLPYYAFPIPGASVGQAEVLESIPPGYIKKWHRVADNKRLYRNFNSAFENVGGPRG